MDRAELDRLAAIMGAPSGAFRFMVENRDEYREQLHALLPGRHFVKSSDDVDVATVYVPDDYACSVAKFIFAGDAFDGNPESISRADEHASWNYYGGWPWEAKSP